MTSPYDSLVELTERWSEIAEGVAGEEDLTDLERMSVDDLCKALAGFRFMAGIMKEVGE